MRSFIYFTDSLEGWRAEIGLILGSSRCCVRYSFFSLNDLFIAINVLLRLISLISGFNLNPYLNLHCIDYVFHFMFISLTSESNQVCNNSYHSTCKQFSLCNAIQFARIHTSSLINNEEILNRAFTKFCNKDDVNVIAADLRLT